MEQTYLIVCISLEHVVILLPQPPKRWDYTLKWIKFDVKLTEWLRVGICASDIPEFEFLL